MFNVWAVWLNTRCDGSGHVAQAATSFRIIEQNLNGGGVFIYTTSAPGETMGATVRWNVAGGVLDPRACNMFDPRACGVLDSNADNLLDLDRFEAAIHLSPGPL